MTAESSAPRGASDSTADRALVNPAQLLSTRLTKIALSQIGDAIEKDETAACRIRSNERPCTLSEFCKLLELCHLKLVDRDRVCVDRQAYESMVYIAQKAMANQATAKSLIWEDD